MGSGQEYKYLERLIISNTCSSHLEVTTCTIYNLSPTAIVNHLVLCQNHSHLIVLLNHRLPMSCLKQVLMDFNEVHWLLHVSQELMCPQNLTTEWWHVMS